MRKIMFVLSLAGLMLLTSASNAFAQYGGYGGGWGNWPSVSIGNGCGGFYSPYGYYSGGYHPYYQTYGSAYQYAPSYYGSGYRPYYQTYGSAYQYAPSYYGLAQSFSVTPATYYDVQPQIRQAFYPAPAAVQQSVAITVLVPTSDTQVWFENNGTTQQGMQRVFHSPPLEPNRTYTYSIKARWMQNGHMINQERRVNVQAGQSVTVNFRASTGETLAPQLP